MHRTIVPAVAAVACLATAVAAQTTVAAEPAAPETEAAPTETAPAGEPPAQTAEPTGETGAAEETAAEPAVPDAERRARVLAKVGETTLTVGAFEDQLSASSVPLPVRVGYSDPARVRTALDERVDRMVLAAWALREGLDQRGDIRREVRKLFRGITLYRQVHQTVGEEDVSDDDVAAYYESHPDLYNRPETVNGGLVLLSDRTTAETALSRALAVRGNRAELTKIVRELSADDDSKRRGGSLGYFDRSGKLNRIVAHGQTEPSTVDPAVVAAAFELTTPFDVYDQVVDTARGPAVVFILNRTPAMHRTLEEVSQRIRLELVNERRDEARESFVSEAVDRYHVRVHDESFDHVVVAPGTPDMALNPHGGLGAPPIGPRNPPTVLRPPGPLPAPGAGR